MAENESFEENEADYADYKPSFVVIAIDTHEAMFIKQEDEAKSPFEMALIACGKLADSLIFNQNSRSWSQFAVVFADEDSKAELVDFKTNLLDSVKKLKEICGLTNEELKKKYMRKGPFDLGPFLLFCKRKFKEIKYSKRTLIYITNDDNPTGSDGNKKFTALNEVKAFESHHIIFQIITLNRNFDYTKFYNELFSLQEKVPACEEIAEDVDGLKEKLLNTVTQRYTMKKIAFFPFKNDDKRYLNVVQKKFVKEAKLNNNQHIDRNTGSIVKKFAQAEETDSNNDVQVSCKNALVTFNELEVAQIYDDGYKVGLTLLYVSDRITSEGFVLKGPAVLEINNEETEPFVSLYNNLWQSCYANRKVLVCVRKFKKQDKIRYVELIPKVSFNKRMFLIVCIPFVNEIKHVPLNEPESRTNSYSPEQYKVVDKLIDSMTFYFHPGMFSNPIYRKKEAYVRSKLLEEPMDDVYDNCLESEQLDKIIRDTAREFKRLFNLEEGSGAAGKRKQPASGGARGRKVAKK